MIGYRWYTLRVFKSAPGLGVYGSKTYTGDLAQMCALAMRLFSPREQCRVVGQGRYAIGDGLAELRAERGARC